MHSIYSISSHYVTIFTLSCWKEKIGKLCINQCCTHLLIRRTISKVRVDKLPEDRIEMFIGQTGRKWLLVRCAVVTTSARSHCYRYSTLSFSKVFYVIYWEIALSYYITTYKNWQDSFANCWLKNCRQLFHLWFKENTFAASRREVFIFIDVLIAINGDDECTVPVMIRWTSFIFIKLRYQPYSYTSNYKEVILSQYNGTWLSKRLLCYQSIYKFV